MGEGNVYQLDENNKAMKDEYHFIIVLDSLANSAKTWLLCYLLEFYSIHQLHPQIIIIIFQRRFL